MGAELRPVNPYISIPTSLYSVIGYETSNVASGNFAASVRFDYVNTCDDPQIAIFPLSNSFSFSPCLGVIQAVFDCGILKIIGQETSAMAFGDSISIGQTYTLVLLHNSSAITTSALVLDAAERFVTRVSIDEAFTRNTVLRAGFAADSDNIYYPVTFTDFQFPIPLNSVVPIGYGRVNTVSRNGNIYSTLSDVPIYHDVVTGSCQSTPIALPVDWIIARSEDRQYDIEELVYALCYQNKSTKLKKNMHRQNRCVISKTSTPYQFILAN